MRVLHADQWIPKFLDETPSPEALRLRPLLWIVVRPVSDAFFVRQGDPRLVMNYLRDIGVRRTLQKIASRRGERYRNERFLSCGLARADKAPDAAVVFIAPMHPRCMERVVLPKVLLRETEIAVPPKRHISFHDVSTFAASDEKLRHPQQSMDFLAGWSYHSGTELEEDDLRAALKGAESLCRAMVSRAPARVLVTGSEVRERLGRPQDDARRPTATISGFGNYAKTNLLPVVKKHFVVEAVHELDPTQIGPVEKAEWRWDTSARLDWRSASDVYFIAGFHHLHAPLAVEGLSRGRAVVSEKPIATTWDQLESLCQALTQRHARFFNAYQRRYFRFNDFLRVDLPGLGSDPMNYSCIVYEVPPPRLHWYRWPVSRGKIVANGCHWIDHFLFLNGFSQPRRLHASKLVGGDAAILLELENESSFNMILTYKGSSRIGMENRIEIRSGNATATVTNDRRYFAHNNVRVLRKKSLPKLSHYTRMYEQIARRILMPSSGDDIDSTRLSAATVLELQDRYDMVTA